MSWLELQTHATLAEYYCMLALSLDSDELARYEWWVNSQQDPKKFKWSSPDKAGTQKAGGVMQNLLNLAGKFGKNIPKGSAHEYAKATGKTVIYIDLKTRKYYTEDMQETTYDPKQDKEQKYVVIPLRNV